VVTDVFGEFPDAFGIEQLLDRAAEDDEIVFVELFLSVRDFEFLAGLFADGADFLGGVLDDGVEVDLVVAHDGALEKGGVP